MGDFYQIKIDKGKKIRSAQALRMWFNWPPFLSFFLSFVSFLSSLRFPLVDDLRSKVFSTCGERLTEFRCRCVHTIKAISGPV